MVVLVVDDESMVLEVLYSAMQDLGVRVLTANDGVEALKIYADAWREIDAVVMDLAMPRLGGEEAFIRLKEINPRVKVVFASGCVDPEIRSWLLEAGAVAILEKPFTVSVLLDLITPHD